MADEPNNEGYQEEMGTVQEELQGLKEKMETEGADFQKAKKVLDDLYDAQTKRIQAEENAAEQERIAEETRLANEQLLRSLFREQELEIIINSTNDENVTEEDKELAQ